MKKRWNILILINILIFSLCACDAAQSNDEKDSQNKTKQENTQKNEIVLSQPTNEKYTYCNSRNLYECRDGIISQYTLSGKHIQSYEIDADFTLLYVNEEELIVLNEKESLCSIPIQTDERGDILKMEDMTELLHLSDGETSGYIWSEHLYADAEYLVYITNDYSLRVYDRKQKKYIELRNAPQARYFFSDASILDSTDGEYVVLSTKRPSCGLLLYHIGEEDVTVIDEWLPASAPFLLWRTAQKVIYAYDAKDGQGETVWSYDCKEKKTERLISSQILTEALNSEGNQGVAGEEKNSVTIDHMYLDGDTLYMECSPDGHPLFLSYDLNRENKVEAVHNLNQNIDRIEGKLLGNGLDADDVSMWFAFAEGRCLLEIEIYYVNGLKPDKITSEDEIIEKDDIGNKVGKESNTEAGEEGEAEVENQFVCFSPHGDTYDYITENDTEKILFQSMGLWIP